MPLWFRPDQRSLGWAAASGGLISHRVLLATCRSRAGCWPSCSDTGLHTGAATPVTLSRQAAHQRWGPMQDVLSKLSWTAAGELSPMAAIFGGIVGQEAMKAISGKFHPIHQFLYFDAVEALPASPPSLPDLSSKVPASVP